MRRALFHFVSAVSVLLFVATLVLWVRGRRTMDHFWLIHGDEGSELIRSSQGRFTLRHTRPNGRSRITLPRRVSHWACAVGSQLPPKKSPGHWQWRFLTYEGVGAATPAEITAARNAKQQAEATLTQLRTRIEQPIDPRDSAAVAAFYQRRVAAMQAERALFAADRVLSGSNYWEWTFPAWLAALVLAAPPALWLAGWQRRRRIRREGRCPNCGYDLRASGERCPECGRLTGARPAPAPGPVGSG